MITVNVINGDEVNEKTFYFTKDEPALLRLSLGSGGWHWGFVGVSGS